MADTDKKYIPEGVFLVCDQGGEPTQLICDPHPINLYGVRYADENDNKPHLNITSFGTCKTMGRCQPPLLLEWTKLKEDVRLHGARPLLEDSECVCQIGSGVIKIFFDGHAAAQAAEDNNESSFVKESISSNVLGMLTSGPLGLISPKFREGVGRGLKKGAEGTWNFVTHDAWQGETWVGMGKMAVIAAAYGTPGGAFTADATLGSLDSMFGTNFRQTRDAIAGGVERAVGNSVENVRRGNWGEVGEDVGQIQYAVVEAVVGTKGAGLALKGAKTAGALAVGAQRLAQITAQAQRALQVLRNGVGGIVKVGRRVDDAGDLTPAQVRALSTAEKGIFGEAKADEFMGRQGFSKLNGPPARVGDAPHGQGIDGVYRNSNPPPTYVVGEAKYGTSRLGNTRDGPQMSDNWIDRRLDDAVGREMADRIRAEGYEKWVLRVDENGNVVRTRLP